MSPTEATELENRLTGFDFTDATVHVLLVGFSTLVLNISALAYAERRNRRYMFLSLAFGFLALTQVIELIETIFFSSELIVIPFTGIHVSHFLDLLMLSSFSVALLVKAQDELRRV
jgi:hypothetical protein